MKNAGITLPVAFMSMFGFAAYAQAQVPDRLDDGVHLGKSAAPSDDDVDSDDSTPGDGPSRPGHGTHFSRNGIEHGNDDSDDSTPGDGPSRPGHGTHFSRNGIEHDNDDHPVTGKDSYTRNKHNNQTYNDVLDAAGGQHHR